MEIQSDLSYACIGICFTCQKHKGLFRSRGCWERQHSQQQNEWLGHKPEWKSKSQQLQWHLNRASQEILLEQHWPACLPRQKTLLVCCPAKGAGLGYSIGQLTFVKCSFLSDCPGEKPSLPILHLELTEHCAKPHIHTWWDTKMKLVSHGKVSGEGLSSWLRETKYSLHGCRETPQNHY